MALLSFEEELSLTKYIKDKEYDKTNWSNLPIRCRVDYVDSITTDMENHKKYAKILYERAMRNSINEYFLYRDYEEAIKTNIDMEENLKILKDRDTFVLIGDIHREILSYDIDFLIYKRVYRKKEEKEKNICLEIIKRIRTEHSRPSPRKYLNKKERENSEESEESEESMSKKAEQEAMKAELEAMEAERIAMVKEHFEDMEREEALDREENSNPWDYWENWTTWNNIKITKEIAEMATKQTEKQKSKSMCGFLYHPHMHDVSIADKMKYNMQLVPPAMFRRRYFKKYGKKTPEMLLENLGYSIDTLSRSARQPYTQYY